MVLVQSNVQLKISLLEIIKLIFGLVFLVPIRFPLTLATVVISWAIAKLAIIGIPEKDLEETPLQGWRKCVTRGVCRFLGSVLLMNMGMR